MCKNEKLIRDNIDSLLSHPQVQTKMEAIGGKWNILNDEFHGIHANTKNIDFTLLFESGDRCITIHGKINRDSKKFSKITVEDTPN